MGSSACRTSYGLAPSLLGCVLLEVTACCTSSAHVHGGHLLLISPCPLAACMSHACRFTEADLRLFPTIARFDAVYATLFRCCRHRVADYPHLAAWAAEVQQIRIPGQALRIRVREWGGVWSRWGTAV